eukprot:223196_1
MSMVCGAYDCNEIRLTALDFNQFDLYCNDTDSCTTSRSSYPAYISGVGSNQFNVHCSNEGSCKAARISCPIHQEQACHIDCAAYTESCTGMYIYVPSNYVYNYLDIRCPSEALYPPTFEVCNDIVIYCDDWRDGAYLSYDFNDDTWNCGVYAASSYCCPYLGTPTVPTTKVPSKKPSTNDPSTQAPTRAPSTKVPTTKTPSSKASTTKPPTPTMATTRETDITSAMDANNAQAQAQTDQSHYFGSVIAVIVVFSTLVVILLVVLILVIIFDYKACDRKTRNPPDHALSVELVEQSANKNNAKIEVNYADVDNVANALEGKDNDVVQQINQTAF